MALHIESSTLNMIMTQHQTHSTLGENYVMNHSTDKKYYLGLGKTTFNSSVCVLHNDGQSLELWSSERHSRKKADGSWPEHALKMWKEYYGKHESGKLEIAENRDVKTPLFREKQLNRAIPFFEHVKAVELEQYSSGLNTDIKFLPHHYCHAMIAKFMSPFERTAILVIDGAGSHGEDIPENHPERKFVNNTNLQKNEEYSIYLLEHGKLTTIKKHWQQFFQSKKFPKHWYSDGLGTCYEKVAEYIFNSKRAAGKVMALAGLGTPGEYNNSMELLESLDWNNSFSGKSKKEWEESPHLKHYQDIAASIQKLFEEKLILLGSDITKLIPNITNLIITGGCALNCVSNMRLLKKNIFKNIYVPPNPGDECIGIGAALALYYCDHPWRLTPHENQHGYFGASSSVPSDLQIKTTFDGYRITKHDNIAEDSAELIAQGKILAWFQGRSEAGPRALGNRSILARVDKHDLKNYLNQHVKYREDFRPYGCSVNMEKCREYFDIPKNFQNPYMSFAVDTRDNFRKTFKEVTHIDGTSRIQVVSVGQNKLFHALIEKVGEKTGLYAVLNTSLNIMGEPIVENILDARNFLDHCNVDNLVIGNYIVAKNLS